MRRKKTDGTTDRGRAKPPSLSLPDALSICTQAIESTPAGVNRHLSAAEKSAFSLLAEFVEEQSVRTEANMILIWRYLLSASFHVDGATALELERMVADVRERCIV